MGNFKFKCVVYFVCTLLTISSFCQNSSIYFSNFDFERYLSDPHFIIYNQYALDNYCGHPTINYLEKLESNDEQNNNFGLTTDFFVSSMNFSLRLHPSYQYKKLKFGLTLPYNFLVSSTFNKIGDIMLFSSYNFKKKSLTNTTTIALSVPTGQEQPNKIFYYIDGTGSLDLLLSNNILANRDNYGFYGNLMLRYSLESKRTFTFIYDNTDFRETQIYNFSNGLFSQLSVGGWVSACKNLNFHYGMGTTYNTLTKYDVRVNYSWTEDVPEHRFVKDNRNFLNYDFRLGLTTRIRSVDISVFAINKIYSSYDSTSDFGMDLLIKFKWEIL